MPFSALFVWIGSLLALQGCGQSTVDAPSISAASTACASHTAEILVGDGYLETLCGCTGTEESAGKIFPSGTPLTCHLGARSDTLFFFFLALVCVIKLFPQKKALSQPALYLTQIIQTIEDLPFSFLKQGPTDFRILLSQELRRNYRPLIDSSRISSRQKIQSLEKLPSSEKINIGG